MRKITANLAVLLLGALLLVGCQGGAEVRVSGTSGKPSFTLKKEGLWPKNGICFYDLNVLSEAPTGPQYLWGIASSNSSCVNLARIDYGVEPVGFRTVIKPHGLIDGNVYTFTAHGDDWIGQAKFKYEGAKYQIVP